jgi:hypothetical protein
LVGGDKLTLEFDNINKAFRVVKQRFVWQNHMDLADRELFHAKNGIVIISDSAPWFDGEIKRLFVRGCNMRADRIWAYLPPSYYLEDMRTICEAVREYNFGVLCSDTDGD